MIASDNLDKKGSQERFTKSLQKGPFHNCFKSPKEYKKMHREPGISHLFLNTMVESCGAHIPDCLKYRTPRYSLAS